MSYHYTTDTAPSISGERLQKIAYAYGFNGVGYGNIARLAEVIAGDYGLSVIATDWSNFSLEVHLGWTAERDGLRGITDRFKSFDGVIDAGEFTIEDENGSTMTVTVE